MTGSQISNMVQNDKISTWDTGESDTKWRRLFAMMTKPPQYEYPADPVVVILEKVFDPVRGFEDEDSFKTAKAKVNEILSLYDFKIDDSGKVVRKEDSSSSGNVEIDSSGLIKSLKQRNCHKRIISLCQNEKLDGYYDVVFEALKDLIARISQLSGYEGSNQQVVGKALNAPKDKNPHLLLTPYLTQTEKDEQNGLADIIRGLLSAFRNPAAHETRTRWDISEQDAFDVLGMISLIHRRLDGAGHSTN